VQSASSRNDLVDERLRYLSTRMYGGLAERFRDDEAEMLAIIASLDAKEADLAMQKWVNVTRASRMPQSNPPPEDTSVRGEAADPLRRSRTSSAVIDKAIELCETDNPRDNDTRSPAERRGEALADVCGFYVDYQNRITADPDAEMPVVPKKRNWPQLIAVNTTNEMQHREGAQLINGPRIDHQAYEALSCTAQLLRLVLDEHGAIRSYDLMPSTVTDALFGAVAARDQHCRWPGCHKKPIHCDIHHLHYRENGGPNTPSCAAPPQRIGGCAAETRLCHRVHGTLQFTYADGTTETTIPPIRQPGLPWAR
jgi:hypothetical protein